MPPQAPQAEQQEHPPRLVVANAKGGVGKTTVSANLIGALADRGLDVLGVDADPQGNLTEALGHLDEYESAPPTMFDVLLDIDSRDDVLDILVEGDEADLIPSSIDMLGSTLELAAAHFLGQLHNGDVVDDRDAVDTATWALEAMTQVVTPATVGADAHGYGLLDDAVARVDGEYDVVVVDAPPGHNPMFKNALYAAPNIIVPATAEASSKGAVDRLFDEIAAFEADTGRDIFEVAAVTNRIRMSTNAADEMTAFLAGVFDDVPVYEIPERVALSYAYDAGESIFKHQPDADVTATFGEAADHVIETFGLEAPEAETGAA